MKEAVDAVVVGAGVVGLAIARSLALAGRQVIVLEKNAAIGSETSSRSSEVIHAGIYYTPGSLKAHSCVLGRDALYRFCQEKGIAHRRCGKLIVAVTARQTARLEILRETAAANGVTDVEYLSRRELAALEPAVRGEAALLSPSTGIVDSHGLMLALQGDLEGAGGHVALRSALLGGRLEAKRVALRIDAGGEALEMEASCVVNAAGLHAGAVARSITGIPDAEIPVIRYAKGNYFTYAGRSPFAHLVYPLPEPGGLGIHATLDLAGGMRFGPDVEWTEQIDYRLDEQRAAVFYASIRRYWPELPDASLRPGYVGVRPKLSAPGEPPADFLVSVSREPHEAQVVQLFGIESPGLTAALALAEHVRERLES